MGRKTKNKEKIQARREERAQLIAAQAVTDKANKIPDPLEPFKAFHLYKKGDFFVKFECKKVTSLNPETIDWIFKLEKDNMEVLYNTCDWGWNDKKKREEMTEDQAWYLIARGEDGTPVAFSHFRFDVDYGDEVLYCYELQLEPSVRRHGLGKFMMQILELMAFSNQMKKVILTVLNHNSTALAFFYSLNYTKDETNLDDTIYEQFCYIILSKYNKKLLK
uniref:N-alpha-acetyltransferase 40 n=1 Tax=Clastoptera arizonana TaxID=38151 RepID=A0A1B6E3A6_9HEMI